MKEHDVDDIQTDGFPDELWAQLSEPSHSDFRLTCVAASAVIAYVREVVDELLKEGALPCCADTVRDAFRPLLYSVAALQCDTCRHHNKAMGVCFARGDPHGLGQCQGYAPDFATLEKEVEELKGACNACAQQTT